MRFPGSRRSGPPAAPLSRGWPPRTSLLLHEGIQTHNRIHWKSGADSRGLRPQCAPYLQGRPAALRIRHGATPAAGRGDWAEAWVRIDSVDAAVLDLLALGPEVEVLHPPQLRAQLARAAGQIADLHRGPP